MKKTLSHGWSSTDEGMVFSGAEVLVTRLKDPSDFKDYVVIPRPQDALPAGVITEFMVSSARKKTMYLLVLRPYDDGGYSLVDFEEMKPSSGSEVTTKVEPSGGIEVCTQGY